MPKSTPIAIASDLLKPDVSSELLYIVGVENSIDCIEIIEFERAIASVADDDVVAILLEMNSDDWEIADADAIATGDLNMKPAETMISDAAIGWVASALVTTG